MILSFFAGKAVHRPLRTRLSLGALSAARIGRVETVLADPTRFRIRADVVAVANYKPPVSDLHLENAALSQEPFFLIRFLARILPWTILEPPAGAALARSRPGIVRKGARDAFEAQRAGLLLLILADGAFIAGGFARSILKPPSGAALALGRFRFRGKCAGNTIEAERAGCIGLLLTGKTCITRSGLRGSLKKSVRTNFTNMLTVYIVEHSGIANLATGRITLIRVPAGRALATRCRLRG